MREATIKDIPDVTSGVETALSREKLFAMDERNPMALATISEYMQTSAANTLGDSFDLGVWGGVTLRTKGTLTVGKSVTLVGAPYALGALGF